MSDQYLQHLESAVVAASSGSAEASRQLDAERCNSADGLAGACLELLRRRGWGIETNGSSGHGTKDVAQYDAVSFYALTTLQRSPILSCQSASAQPNDAFASLRGQLRSLILTSISRIANLLSMPQFVSTKVGVLLALLVREEYPAGWASPFGDVLVALNASSTNGGNSPEGEMARMGMYLSFLNAISDEIVDPVVDETNVKADNQRVRVRREQVKNALRGYFTNETDQSNSVPLEPCLPLERTDAANIVGWLLNVLTTTAQPGNPNEALAIAVRSTATMKRYLSWIDLRLAMDGTLDRALLAGLGGASPGDCGDDEPTQRTLLAVECANCLREIVDRGMEEEKKLALLTELGIFGTLCRLSQLPVAAVSGAGSTGAGKLDLVNDEGTQIEAVAAAADLINTSGLALIQGWELDPTHCATRTTPTNMQMEQCLELTLACLAYDSIDVSGAVVDLVSRILASLEKKEDYWNKGFGDESICNKILSRVLLILHLRMKYPPDFQFDYEDEEEAEEELYRTHLRKLYQRIVRLRPDTVLQFVGQCLSSLPQPLSSSPTPDVEVALRFVYHYGEGRRPAPGAKTSLKDPPFREMVMALHRSDISSHPHREVLLLYYDLSVRYATLLKEMPDLLTLLLGSLSGNRGLQHPHERVRCRCCYLLLRLIKSVGAKAMLPHVEAVVDGVQQLLFPPEPSEMHSIPPNEALYLFEATGLLLGTTGLDTAVQVRCATAVLTPHIRSIEQTLQHPDLTRDVETYGESLSLSISAIAQLSKGWQKHPPLEVQAVLAAAEDVCLKVVVALPSSPLVRNRTAVLLQRMILCLGERILPSMPSFFGPLLSQCTLEDDVLDVSQLMNQLCIKFKEKAAAALDASLMPFLQRVLAIQLTEESIGGPGTNSCASGISPPPHLITEQLSVRKQAFATLQHIALYNASAVLYSATNVASLGDVLKLMSDGATTVPDPVMKKTCTQFFCELIEYFLPYRNPEPANRERPVDGRQGPAPPVQVVESFIDFVYGIFVPGMIRCTLDSSFNAKDAQSCRVLSEFCRALWYLKQSGGAEFQSRVIDALVIGGGAPDGTAVGFQNAASGKDMELILKAWKGEI